MFDWQTIVVLVIVFAAAAYLGRCAWLTLARKKSGCGACAKCPASETTAAGQPLVSINTLTRPR